ncbi:hypothetical protein [Sphingobacterium sp.]|uniref:hypothetical protein n=1 Tax=Sphingobacterium sp. TaxID=341027 RepID=UPI00289FD92E|nr:hypothetical protein [Sphingobacterium sp.]
MIFLHRFIHLSGLIAALLFSLNSFAQTHSTLDSNVKAIHFVDALLPEGNYVVEILGAPSMNAAQAEILEKMKLSIKQHEEWFVKTMKELKPGEPIPYHSNLGISEQEYAVFMQFSEAVKMDKIGVVRLKILRKDNSIYFEPVDFPQYLKELSIHLKDHTILVDSIALKYKSHRVMDSKNTTLAAGAWKGYSWEFEEISKDGKHMVDRDQIDPSEIGALDIKSIKLTIGQLDHSNQCFLYLKSDIVNKGHVIAKQDMALLLSKE